MDNIELMKCKNCSYYNNKTNICEESLYYNEKRLTEEEITDIEQYTRTINQPNVSPEHSCANWTIKNEKLSLGDEKLSIMLNKAFNNIKEILKKYLDWSEEKYTIVALWIIGTYFHNKFPTFPYLFLNAMKSSGKSRALNLITTLSKDGSVLNSLTEAVLFRTKGTLGIDEFEGIERKGKEALRELLNSSYKKGIKVKRMKKVKGAKGEEQIVEEFDVYRPIVMANISGMESVLGDRCIPLIIEKSFNKKIINLLEIFNEEKLVLDTKKLLIQCSLCRCSFSGECYKEWNDFILSNYTNTTYNTNNTNNTNCILPLYALRSLNLSTLSGRDLELSFPLLMIAMEISKDSEDLLKETTLILESIFSTKKDEEMVENFDISLTDFLSQEPEEEEGYFITINSLTEKFRQFLQSNEEWINPKWMGRALKRLNLIKEKRRRGRGIEIIISIKKAQEKIRMFR